jgi:hypothetical protein
MDEDRSYRGTKSIKSTSGDRWQIAFEFRPSRIPSQVVEFRHAIANQPTLEPPRKHFHWLIVRDRIMQRLLPRKPIGAPQLEQGL